MSWTNTHRRFRASKLIELCLGSREFPAAEVAAGALGSAVHLRRWKRWSCGVHLWIRCGSIKLTLVNLRCPETVNIVHVFGCLVSFSLVASLYGVYV